ncbi:low-specificity L-threonine aldolase [Microscilla marina]|uniref:L-allo-threonine aldolase n=1 Tax=Microscilla marina ATCC 23134 TaxID=313606 RepID=A1ZF89_MICM2|nr:low-specificity L-threonine aldolase [Microscilla marina]EAY31191.1 L-allo-threonine aldolase [Microscilla marina ATCC 23134]
MTQSTKKIDLRSDTVTQPTADMRHFMAEAKVGDDMYQEDPTVNALQEEVADLLGKEKALYVPTGSMANQIAIKLLTQPGDGMIVGNHAHNWMFESGAAGFISSIQLTPLTGDGRFTAQDVKAAYKPNQAPYHFAPTRLVSIENTHNVGGGLVWNQGEIAQVLATADELKIAKHLDGARLWNAAIYYGTELHTLTQGFDTVSVCLSKGLGAPVGSLLAGNSELIEKAYRYRRIMGGAMRQAGIIAAGGLYAVHHHRERLSEDHTNAQFLAKSLNEIKGLKVNIDSTHTNIVMADLTDKRLNAQVLEQKAKDQGILFLCVSDQRIRLVTHLDITQQDCEKAVETIQSLIKKSFLTVGC